MLQSVSNAVALSAGPRRQFPGRSRRSAEHLQRLEELKAAVEPGMKVCSQCLEIKPLGAFYNRARLSRRKAVVVQSVRVG